KWLAYSSSESGREEVYVVPFPVGNGRWQVSQNGGTVPTWRADGKELFYAEFLAAQTTLYGVDVNINGPEFQIQSVKKLFALSHTTAPGNNLLEVTPDGRRFLVVVQPETEAVPITLVVNWPAELSQ